MKKKKEEFPLVKIERILKKLSKKELMKRIIDESNNLIDHASSLRIQGKIGKYAQKSIEEQIAAKYRCVKFGEFWVQLYLGEDGLEIPAPIKTAIIASQI